MEKISGLSDLRIKEEQLKFIILKLINNQILHLVQKYHK